VGAAFACIPLFSSGAAAIQMVLSSNIGVCILFSIIRHPNRRRTGNCRTNWGMYKNIETRQQILILINIILLDNIRNVSEE